MLRFALGKLEAALQRQGDGLKQFARAHDVAPWSVSLSHIGKESETNELVVRYTREVVTQVLDEYPNLTGLGITLGLAHTGGGQGH